jgi:hypothetical protein
MPLIAFQGQTGEKIDISKVENLWAVLKSGDWVCQLTSRL